MGSDDNDRYETVFRREHESILHAAHLVTGDAELARDVTQDAFAEMFVHWRRVRRMDRPGAWVRRVAIRKAIRATRRESARPVLEERRAAGRRPGNDMALDVSDALAQLSAMQRAAVVLRYWDGLAVSEVAEALSISPSTASVHLSRARSRLAELMAEEGGGDV